MPNELIFAFRIIIDLIFVALLFRLGKAGLYAAIVVNLLLVSIWGGKLVNEFGFITNSGNVFYACVFLATNLLTEHYGKKEGFRSIIVGFSALMLFMVMGQTTLQLNGLPQSQEIDTAMRALFENIPRLAFASMAAYLVSQFLGVTIYDYLRNRFHKSHIWLRNAAAVFAGQFADSIIFFLIAFGGIVSDSILLQAISAGFALKVLIGLISTPVLYWSQKVKSIAD